MSKELYVKGAKIWIPDSKTVWKCVELTEDYNNNLISAISKEGTIIKLERKSDALPLLKNPDILIGQNDLTSLSYLHEPAVLYNLKVRFCDQRAIYTYCGIVLVAINPYHELQIYGPETILAYRGQQSGNLDPHIFAISEEAYTQMGRENKDQSIIVSGESGAGKTVSAKYCMRYFASVGGSVDETQIEKKILASNPIMEAFGNAKTTRNDNSSRFGKYIELDFSENFHIVGANMRTYLLEKSRVVFQAVEERNYHIFYQLCSSGSHPLLENLNLTDFGKFHYLNQGFLWDEDEVDRHKVVDNYTNTDDRNFNFLLDGSNSNVVGVDDSADFETTCHAFSLLGFSEDTKKIIFRILAAILHMGNIEIIDSSNDSAFINDCDDAFMWSADLLGVESSEMRKWMLHRKIVSGREVFTKPLTKNEAVFCRDALAKAIYLKLFEWIVVQINKCFACTSVKPFRFIGVLDIYGFETFETNSFEQFCINYANEKLQQQFNQHVFKLEQEEYIREGLEWSFISFYDNQPCIDLIEARVGVLDLLDEECKMPKGSDTSLSRKLYKECLKFENFSKPRISESAFLIKHFADTVTYETEGFLEKNRDTLNEELVNSLKYSQITLVKDLFTEKALPMHKTKIKVGTPQNSLKQMKKSVGFQFRDSLSLLMQTLNSTTPHYVRCIKPNDEKESFSFDELRAIQQLRACGVLETVRISAAGYPSRWSYEDFVTRYRLLCRFKEINRKDPKKTCEKVIQNINAEGYKFGLSKIFFRAGQVAYLEKLRDDKLRSSCVMIQKFVRAFLARKKYAKMRLAAVCIQKYIRRTIAIRVVKKMRREAAAITIQSHVRAYFARKRYEKSRDVIIRIQAVTRGRKIRKLYRNRRRVKATLIIQRYVRGFLAKRRYERIQRGIVQIQTLVRCFLARKQLKKLKIEAKSVEHQKQLNKGLENKIISLQQKLTQTKSESARLKKIEADISTLTEKLKNKDEQIKLLQTANKENKNLIEQFENQLKTTEKEGKLLLKQKEMEKSELKSKINELEVELAKKPKVVYIERAVETQPNDTEREQYEHMLEVLTKERDDARASHQEVLVMYYNLEDKYEEIQFPNRAMTATASVRTARPLSEAVSSARNPTLLRRKRRNYMGMFAYDQTDEETILKDLVQELRPRIAITLTPCLPAYILFMCVRHTDHINDDEKVGSLLSNFYNSVQRVLKRHKDELEYHILWLANILRFVHCLKQYSGEIQFQKENTPKQNEQSLNNFDLSDHKKVFSDLSIKTYNNALFLITKKLLPSIVPAILENEGVQGLHDPNPLRRQSIGGSRRPSQVAKTNFLEDVLIKELTELYKIMTLFGCDPEIIAQAFKQIFYFICAYSLNNLLLRKDMCKWSVGIQIRFNLSHLEQWTRDMQLPSAEVCETLAPIIQAAQLLQARKSENDVQSVCDLCDKLTTSQIIKILNLYTPSEEFEERVPTTFKESVMANLQKRTEVHDIDQESFLMDTKFSFPLTFPYNPSSMKLEDIEIPPVLNLSVLKKV